MAKKRQQKQVQKEEKEFVFPEFDKDEFMRNEMRGAKTTLIGSGFGIVMAFVSYGVAFASPGVAFMVGLLSMALLKFVFESANIDLTEFGWKGWGGSAAVYFFTWLLVWILISNPPISDLAPPEVHGAGVFAPEVDDRNLTGYHIQPSEPLFNVVDNHTLSMVIMEEKNDRLTPVTYLVERRLTIVAVVTDNDELFSVRITVVYNGSENLVDRQSMSVLDVDDFNATDEDLEDQWKPREDYTYGYELGESEIRGGTYEYTIFALDKGDKETKFGGSFTVNG